MDIGGSQLERAGDEYFREGGGHLHRRVIEDIIDIRDSYEDAWYQLDQKEKEQVINEQIILPEVVLLHQTPPDTTSHPLPRVKTGQKIIFDEDKSGRQVKYRDEHSAPFSWRTKSQQDLTLRSFCAPSSTAPRPQEDCPAPSAGGHASTSTTTAPPITQPPSTGGLDCSGLELVAARRSAILSCPFGQYSRIPRAAIPVPIPSVPPGSHTTEAKCRPLSSASSSTSSAAAGGQGQEEETVATAAGIEEITSLVSSIVIATEDSLVLDFSTPVASVTSATSVTSTGPSTPREEGGGTSATQLLARVKDRTLSLKRSLTPTLRRKKSISSTDTQSTFAGDNDDWLQSPHNTPARPSTAAAAAAGGSATAAAATTGGSATAAAATVSSASRGIYSTVSTARPTVPPPPPPPAAAAAKLPPANQESKPLSLNDKMPPLDKFGGKLPPSAGLRHSVSGSPPAPPRRDPATKISSSASDRATLTGFTTPTSVAEKTESLPPAASEEQLDERAGLLSTADSEAKESGAEPIAKTGFDFLDNW